MSEKASRRRPGLFMLAILLLLGAGAALFFGFSNFPLRTDGLLAMIISIYLARISNIHGRSIPTFTMEPKGPGRLMWTVGVISLLLLGLSYLYLYKDALHDGNDVLPVYVFAGVGLAVAVVWAYIASTLV